MCENLDLLYYRTIEEWKDNDMSFGIKRLKSKTSRKLVVNHSLRLGVIIQLYGVCYVKLLKLKNKIQLLLNDVLIRIEVVRGSIRV